MKHLFYSLRFFAIIILSSIALSSCGNDEKEEIEVKDNFVFPTTVIFRAPGKYIIENAGPMIWVPGSGVEGIDTGHYEFTDLFLAFSVLEFHSDGSVLAYDAVGGGEEGNIVPNHSDFHYDNTKAKSLIYSYNSKNVLSLSDGTTYTFQEEAENVITGLNNSKGELVFVIWKPGDDTKSDK